MKQANIKFTVEIAGIPIEVCCRYPETKAYMNDFLSENKPFFTVEPAEEDFETLRKWTEELVSRGYEEYRFSAITQESILIHSKVSEELLNYDVLLVHGDKDEAVPVSYSIEAQKSYKNATLTMINGDTPCYDYHLEDAVAAVRSWMMSTFC